MAVRVKRVNHVAMSVVSLDDTQRWYEKVLGAVLTHAYDPDSSNKHMRMLVPNANLEFEFFQYVDPAGYQPPVFDLPFDHYHNVEKQQWHLSLEVDDYTGAYNHCRELGLTIVAEFPPNCFFVNDNNGKLIEFKQPPANS